MNDQFDFMKRSGGILFLMVALTACTGLRKPGSTYSAYSENITSLRPRYDEKLSDIQKEDTLENRIDPQVKREPQQDVTEKLDEILNEIIKKNEEIDYASGYTIQVYSGASRENADMVKSEIYKQMPSSRPKVGWVAPNFKVRVGNFIEKIEAQKHYSELKQHFPQAILIPIRIPNTFPPSKY